jgi:hypothetical protein
MSGIGMTGEETAAVVEYAARGDVVLEGVPVQRNCPLCGLTFIPGDTVRSRDGRIVHRSCLQRESYRAMRRSGRRGVGKNRSEHGVPSGGALAGLWRVQVEGITE